jgi:hypothetical protein
VHRRAAPLRAPSRQYPARRAAIRLSRGEAREPRQAALHGLADPERSTPLSRREVARLGGLTTLERHGHEHFREIGRLGYAVTAARYGAEFAQEKAAATRRAYPERASHDEQRMMQLLAALDQGDLLASEPVLYAREHRVAPRIYVDFAWPAQERAIVRWNLLEMSSGQRKL